MKFHAQYICEKWGSHIWLGIASLLEILEIKTGEVYLLFILLPTPVGLEGGEGWKIGFLGKKIDWSCLSLVYRAPRMARGHQAESLGVTQWLQKENQWAIQKKWVSAGMEKIERSERKLQDPTKGYMKFNFMHLSSQRAWSQLTQFR